LAIAHQFFSRNILQGFTGRVNGDGDLMAADYLVSLNVSIHHDL